MMGRFKKSFGFGALEQIVARVFDLATLWVILRTLPEVDLATYGIATSMLFLFHLVLLTPETALIRDKLKWQKENVIKDYHNVFILFSQLKIVFVILITCMTGWIWGLDNPYFVVCVLALVNQLILCAEIARLDYRIDLKQKEIFKFEIIFKLILLCGVLWLFVTPGLLYYLPIYLFWSVLGALFWINKLNHKYGSFFNIQWNKLYLLKDVLKNFSLWQHFNGVVTYIIYNIDPWVLAWFTLSTSVISLYTVTLKVSALFFMVPMFLQLMTSIMLVNISNQREQEVAFNKMFYLCLIVSIAQFIFFIYFGEWLAILFRGESVNVEEFIFLGLWINAGVLMLNIVRPFISYLMLNARMKKVLIFGYLPSLVISIVLYIALTAGYSELGCAIASMLSYLVFAVMIIIFSYQSGFRFSTMWRWSS